MKPEEDWRLVDLEGRVAKLEGRDDGEEADDWRRVPEADPEEPPEEQVGDRSRGERERLRRER